MKGPNAFQKLSCGLTRWWVSSVGARKWPIKMTLDDLRNGTWQNPMFKRFVRFTRFWLVKNYNHIIISYTNNLRLKLSPLKYRVLGLVWVQNSYFWKIRQDLCYVIFMHGQSVPVMFRWVINYHKMSACYQFSRNIVKTSQKIVSDYNRILGDKKRNTSW